MISNLMGRKSLQNPKIHRKLILFYSLFIMLLLLLTVAIFSVFTVKTFFSGTKLLMAQSADFTRAKADYYINAIDAISSQADFQANLLNYAGSESQEEYQGIFQCILPESLLKDPSIGVIKIISENGNSVTFGKRDLSNWTVKAIKPYANLDENKPCWRMLHYWVNPDRQLILIKRVKSPVSGNRLGYLALAIENSGFKSVPDNIDSQKQNIFILTSDGMVISSNSQIDAPAHEILIEQIKYKGDSPSFSLAKSENMRYLLSTYYLKETGWYIVGAIPLSFLYSSAVKHGILLVVLCFLALLLSYIAATKEMEKIKIKCRREFGSQPETYEIIDIIVYFRSFTGSLRTFVLFLYRQILTIKSVIIFIIGLSTIVLCLLAYDYIRINSDSIRYTFSSSEITKSEQPLGDLIIEKIDYKSKILKRCLPINVYLPQGYSESRKYPVLYLLHGYNGNENDWLQKIGLGEKIRRMTEEGQIIPCIVVAPKIDNSYGMNTSKKTTIIGEYPNQLYHLGMYEDYICSEVVGYIDKNYSTIASREGRFIGGSSMGGLASLHIAFRHKDLFSKVGGHMSALYDGPSPTLYPDENERIMNVPC